MTSYWNQNRENTNIEEEVRSIPGLSNEHVQLLVSLFNNQKSEPQERMTGKNFNTMWIIDSGATNHMTGKRERFCSLRKTGGINIGLPDVEDVTADMEGIVNLDTCFKLNHVLYVPKLKCELISISQLMDEGDYHVQLTQILCVIQD